MAENEKKQFQVRDISELVRQGQDIVVQVVKDPLGTKGARLTTDITFLLAILSLCLVLAMSASLNVLIVKSERNRLKKVVSRYCDEHGGFIIRTAAEGADAHELEQDAAFLKRLWLKVNGASWEA